MRTVSLTSQIHKNPREGSGAPMFTPALRSSASFSGVLTFGPKIPHYAEDGVRDKREIFESATISNGDH